MEIQLRKVVLALFLCDGVILLIGFGQTLFDYPSHLLRVLFSLDLDWSAAAAYSGLKLFVLSILLFCLAAGVGRAGRADRLLLFLALMFAMMAFDELAGLHERAQDLIRDLGLNEAAVKSAAAHNLALPALLLTVPVGIAALLFTYAALKSMNRAGGGARTFFAGFLILFAGAVIIDQFVRALFSIDTNIAIGIEEACEFLGVTVMISGAVKALSGAPSLIRIGTSLEAGPSSDGFELAGRSVPVDRASTPVQNVPRQVARGHYERQDGRLG